MNVQAALFVVGESPGTKSYQDVTKVIEWHLDDGRIYSSVRLHGVWREMPVFARAVGTGELCLAGTCASLDAEDVPFPGREKKWPLSYRVTFTHVLRGVHAADVLGSASSTRKLRGLDRNQLQLATTAFADAPRAAAWRRRPD
jgi:hypothetical protein